MSAEFKSTSEVEPISASTPLPMWLLCGTLTLLVGSAVFFDWHGGWFEPKIYAPYTSFADIQQFQPVGGAGADIGRGKKLFGDTCALCHNPDGGGKPGQAPPLAGSDWVNAEGPNRIIRIVLLGLTGPIEVSGKQYNFPSGMTPFGGTYSDEDVAAILTYIRQDFGNKAAPVTAEQVNKVRKEVGNQTQAPSPDQLKKLPEK